MLRFMGSQSQIRLSDWTELNWSRDQPLLLFRHKFCVSLGAVPWCLQTPSSRARF